MKARSLFGIVREPCRVSLNIWESECVFASPFSTQERFETSGASMPFIGTLRRLLRRYAASSLFMMSFMNRPVSGSPRAAAFCASSDLPRRAR